MLILFVTLSVFSTIIYQNFTRSLYINIDNLLKSKAEGIADSINTYWEAEKMEAIKDVANAQVFTKINNINFLKIAQHWVENKSDDPKFINIVVQIFNNQGRHIISSKDIPDIEQDLAPVVIDAILKQKEHFENIKTNSLRGEMRMLTFSITEKGKIVYVVQVATSLSPVYAAQTSLLTLLFLFLPLTVLVTGLLGVFLAKLALKPVDDMIHTIHHITDKNLKLRVSIPNTRDEIERLATTFNTMLSGLDKAFTMQQQFIQDASHELRTPLTILKGEIEVTLKKIRTADDYTAVLQSSLEEINKITRIIENLLTLAKFDYQQIYLEKTDFDLDALIAEVAGNLKILAERKNIKLTYDLESLLTIHADKNQIGRLLSNLIDNAIKYTEPLGTISINLEKEDHHVVIVIQDSGLGIPETDLPHIFDRFYRADKSRHRQGFGLGLSIVKSIVDIHNGVITAKSHIKEGTTFKISLPFN